MSGFVLLHAGADKQITVNPFAVVAITDRGQDCTVHLRGGGQITIPEPGFRVQALIDEHTNPFAVRVGGMDGR